MRTPLPMNPIVALALVGTGAAERTLHAIGAAVQRFHARWRARRQAAAAIRQLESLDARTLRDIGFDRSEITSVVAEMTGDADPSRVRTLRTQRDRTHQFFPVSERTQ